MRGGMPLRGHLLDLGDTVVDDDVDEILADRLGGRTGIAGDAIVHARRCVGILTAAASTAAPAGVCRLRRTRGDGRGAGDSRVARGLPLLRRLAGRIEF